VPATEPPLNRAWAIEQLHEFAAMTFPVLLRAGALGRAPTYGTTADEDQIIVSWPAIEQILDRVLPAWRDVRANTLSPWSNQRAAAMQSESLLVRADELQTNLGDPGPKLDASALHPDVWDAAKSFWRSGHHGAAVEAAAKAINAHLQAKVGRRDLSETKLVADCFSLNAPRAGAPRLRLMDDDGGDTYKSIHEGAAAFGRGCFMAIRNVVAHEYGEATEPSEAEALEYLAAFSVLARWISAARVVSDPVAE
jgi:uncharacterized protein (TIGR02391 family)